MYTTEYEDFGKTYDIDIYFTERITRSKKYEVEKTFAFKEERRKKKYTSNTNFPTNLPFETL